MTLPATASPSFSRPGAPQGTRPGAVLPAALLAAFLVVGCANDPGNIGPAGVDAGAAPDLLPSWPIAAFPSPPQVANTGGSVLAAPHFVPVFFANSDAVLKTGMSDFISRVGASSYWKTIASEYGVGAATSAPAVTLSDRLTGTMTTDQLATWLQKTLSMPSSPLPAADENTLYVLHIPAAVTLTKMGRGGMETSCVDFGGYHSDVPYDTDTGTGDAPYAVVPECPSFGMLMGIDAMTGTESHELIEAATDPYPVSNPAYQLTDADHLYWSFAVGGGEVGDMCAQQTNAFFRESTLRYTVQRMWSNAAATAGHDPCVPPPASGAYFHAAPEVSDMITLGQNYTSVGVQMAVGSSRTIVLDLFSDADTGAAWTVKAHDIGYLTTGQSTLSLTLDKSTGRNGDKVNLTIKLLKHATYGISIFQVTSHLGAQAHDWYGVVGE